YEIIDLGVMVPPEKIIHAAIAEKLEIIGLSGVITPSLDEMAYVSQEMEKKNLNIPLIIGGDTTSRAQTSVKISPYYSSTVVHINDATRAVTVVGNLLQKDNKIFKEQRREEYDKFREQFLKRTKQKQYLSIQGARKNKYKIDWNTTEIIKPKQLGVHALNNFDSKILEAYIDWSPFFRSWDLHGKFPDILNDDIVGKQATELYNDAQNLLHRI